MSVEGAYMVNFESLRLTTLLADIKLLDEFIARIDLPDKIKAQFEQTKAFKQQEIDRIVEENAWLC